MKGSRLQPPVVAFAHDPLHVFLDDFKVPQKSCFKFIASLRILRRLFDPLEGQTQMAVLDRFAKRIRTSKVSIRQLFDVPNAQLAPAHRHDKIFDFLFFCAVHTH